MHSHAIGGIHRPKMEPVNYFETAEFEDIKIVPCADRTKKRTLFPNSIIGEIVRFFPEVLLAS